MIDRSLSDDCDKILGALANVFADEGNTRAVAILALGEATIKQTNYDGWDGGQYGYTVYIQIPQQLYWQMKGEQIAIEEDFCKKVQQITRLYSNESIDAFIIATQLQTDPRWRKRPKPLYRVRA